LATRSGAARTLAVLSVAVLSVAVLSVAVLTMAMLPACAEKPRAEQGARPDRPSVADTAGGASASAATSVFSPLWDSAFGKFVGYNSGDSTAVVLLSSFAANSGADTTLDASPANGARVDLFGRGGLVGSATLGGLGKASDAEGCFEYSRGHVQGASQLHWHVVLPAGSARGLKLEDLSTIHGADSSELVSQIMRLASMIHHKDDSLWRDAKFSIEQGTRVELADAIVVSGSLTWLRPDAEHSARDYFVVGEAPASTPNAGWRLAYVHPDFGVPGDSTASGLDLEDEVFVASAVETKSNSRPVLFLGTRGNEVNGYAAIGRTAPGVWRLVWNGPHEGGC
jgi:hypothetical protein